MQNAHATVTQCANGDFFSCIGTESAELARQWYELGVTNNVIVHVLCHMYASNS